MRTSIIISVILLVTCLFMNTAKGQSQENNSGDKSVMIEVAAEETVYTYVNPNNGSGPLWSFGCTQIVRMGEDVIVSEMETGEDAPLLSNTRWRLRQRASDGWRVLAEADAYLQREPCSVATVSDNTLLLYVNDLITEPGTMYGPCKPHLLKFVLSEELTPLAPEQVLPDWGEPTYFTDHSYRGFAADRNSGQSLMLNIDAQTSKQHASLIGLGGATLANTSITFPIRSCYPQVALIGNSAHVLAISDIIEPVETWRNYKQEQTGREWDYVFRILYYTHAPDLLTGGFIEPIEIANVEATAGHIRNQDLWINEAGEAYILYTEREVQSELMRDQFFPVKSIVDSLHLAVVRDGKVQSRHVLIEGTPDNVPGNARFHVSEDGTLFAVLYIAGSDSGNKLMQIMPIDEPKSLIDIPLESPMSNFCLASVRAGNLPSNHIDLHGQTASATMGYAHVRILQE